MTLTLIPTPAPSKTTLLDDIYRMRERIDRLEAPGHPAYRGLLDRFEDKLDLALNLGYITPDEAVRL